MLNSDNIKQILNGKVVKAQLECLENISKKASSIEDVKAVIKLSKFIKKSYNPFDDILFMNCNDETQEPPNSG